MSASKRKGTAAETDVVNWLRRHGWHGAERRALSGSQDQGDIAGVPGVMLEVKNRRAIELADFLDQTTAQRINAGADIGACLIKRRGKTDPDGWYVLMDGATLAGLLRGAGY